MININGNIIIINVNDIAFTNGCLAPEMHKIDDSISLPWNVRCCNDIWAYGKLLSMIAQLEIDKEQARLLNDVIEEITKIEPSNRVKLCHIIAKLEFDLTSEPVFLLASFMNNKIRHYLS